jgi:hypothetical protein
LVDGKDNDCPPPSSEIYCGQGQDAINTNGSGIADECQPIECSEGEELTDDGSVEVVDDGGNDDDRGLDDEGEVSN